jgi:imidazole glycerol-phosphate synthase subunit HisF
MLKCRLIPVLLLKNGLLIRSEKFSIHQIIGNPIFEVKRFNEWNVDELIYLDITKNGGYDIRREDHRFKGLDNPLKILDEVSKTCFMPLTWGGNIKSISDMKEKFEHGADKVAINTCAFKNPKLIQEAAKKYGDQAIVVSIDSKLCENGKYEVYISGGKEKTGVEVVDWAKKAEEFGAGEILLQSIDRDGTGTGYDVELIKLVADEIEIPLIACSGIGNYEQYAEGFNAGASALSAANIWHFKEMSDLGGKNALKKAGIKIRDYR